MSTPGEIRRELDGIARASGFAATAVASAVRDAETREILLERIARGDFSGLAWFDAKRADVATDPDRLLAGARSILLLAASYAQPTPPRSPGALRGRVARYAWGRDYHRVLAKRARPLLALLDERVPGSRSRFVTDSVPLAERAYARAAGLGWQGKNTMLLSRALGSSFFLAAILTTVELEPDEPTPQRLPIPRSARPSEGRSHCGACTRCLPACPTGALRAPHELVNDRCIAYHTIENRGPIPREMREAIGDWVFGCDLCQDVCPVNESVSPPGVVPELAARDADDAFPDLTAILALDREGFGARYHGRPVARATYAGLLRNACVALGNAGDGAAVPALARALDHAEPLVRGHAAWALGRLHAPGPLSRRLAEETDPWVRDEILQALEEAA